MGEGELSRPALRALDLQPRRTASRCARTSGPAPRWGSPSSPTRSASKDRVDFLALELCNMGGDRDRLPVAAGKRPLRGGRPARHPERRPAAGLGSSVRPHPLARPCLKRRGGARSGQDDGGGLRQARDRGRPPRQARPPRSRAGSRSKESAGCYDLRKAGEVKKAVDALAVALARTESKNILLELRNGGSEEPACH